MSSNSLDVVCYYQIMQKVFALLLSELQKLRASIVFADFSRIIIATGKYNMAAAQGYCEYLLKTLKSRYISYPSHHAIFCRFRLGKLLRMGQVLCQPESVLEYHHNVAYSEFLRSS